MRILASKIENENCVKKKCTSPFVSQCLRDVMEETGEFFVRNEGVKKRLQSDGDTNMSSILLVILGC